MSRTKTTPPAPTWRRFLHRPRPAVLAVLGLALILVHLVVWPLVMLGYGSLRTSSPLAPGDWSLHAYTGLWAQMTTDNALQNSLILALIATPLSGIIGVGMALLAERTDAPLRRLITPVAVIVVVMQGVIYAVGWSLLANKYTGLVNVAYRAFTGTAADQYLVDIETWGGLVAVQALGSAAIVYLLVLGPIRALDRAHDEASLVSGAGRIRTTLLVTIPMLAPIITGVMMIGLLAEFMSLPTGLVLGAPAGIMLLPVKVYDNLNAGNPPPYADAAAVSVVLVAVTLILMFIQTRLLRRRTFTTVTGKPSRRDVWPLGRWRAPVGVLLGLFIFTILVLPLAAIVLASLEPFPGMLSNFSFRNYEAVMASNGFGDLVRNTIVIAVAVGFAAVLLAFLVAYAGVRAGPRVGLVLRGITLLPIAMPGIIGPIAVLWGFVSLPGARALFGTIWLVILALMVRVLPVAVQLGTAAINQVSRDLEDAAMISGQSPFRAAIGITGRLLLPSFLAGWFMAGVLVINNLEVPLLLGGAQTETVATRIYGLYVGSVPSQGAALLVMTVVAIGAVGAIGFGVMKILSRLLTGLSTRKTVPSLVGGGAGGDGGPPPGDTGLDALTAEDREPVGAPAGTVRTSA